MGDIKIIKTTTFQLPVSLHSQLKLMCLLTNATMGEFIRISLRDKIKDIKMKEEEKKVEKNDVYIKKDVI